MSVQIVKDNKFSPVAGELNKTAVFAGQITMGANLSAPYGWLLCDGKAYNIDNYKSLFAAIGKTYNKPDTPSGKFCVPDMRNQFVMGAGTNTVGTFKEAGLPNIEGEAGMGGITGLIVDGSGSTALFQATGQSTTHGPAIVEDSKYHKLSFNASRANPIYGASDTVQPPAVVLNYFIKF